MVSEVVMQGVTLANNKVLAGKSCKMRDTQAITKKSAADLAAIFWLRIDVYSPSELVKPNSNPSTPSNGGIARGSRDLNKKSRDKKGDNNSCLSGKRKKKSKLLSK